VVIKYGNGLMRKEWAGGMNEVNTNNGTNKQINRKKPKKSIKN
jgi:hypothetical protein